MVQILMVLMNNSHRIISVGERTAFGLVYGHRLIFLHNGDLVTLSAPLQSYIGHAEGHCNGEEGQGDSNKDEDYRVGRVATLDVGGLPRDDFFDNDFFDDFFLGLGLLLGDLFLLSLK